MLIQADSRTLPLADGCVSCVVTSPPYWGLRDYGTATWEGGDPDCVHSVGGQVQDTKAPGAITTGQRPGVDASRCRKCGAHRFDQQIGLESTPDAYVAQLGHDGRGRGTARPAVGGRGPDVSASRAGADGAAGADMGVRVLVLVERKTFVWGAK